MLCQSNRHFVILSPKLVRTLVLCMLCSTSDEIGLYIKQSNANNIRVLGFGNGEWTFLGNMTHCQTVTFIGTYFLNFSALFLAPVEKNASLQPRLTPPWINKYFHIFTRIAGWLKKKEIYKEFLKVFKQKLFRSKVYMYVWNWWTFDVLYQVIFQNSSCYLYLMPTKRSQNWWKHPPYSK